MEKLKVDIASSLAWVSLMHRRGNQMTPSIDQKLILPQSNNLEVPPHFPITDCFYVDNGIALSHSVSAISVA
jgi:hypothetical protein